MFRAAVLSIVLTLAVGQDARLLCKAWCDPQEAVAAGCHHQDPASRMMTGDDDCDNVLLRVIALIRDDVRRGVSRQYTPQSLVVPLLQFAPSSPDGRRGRERGQSGSLDKRLPVTTLRI